MEYAVITDRRFKFTFEESSMKYFIGIDGGGTHSRLLAVDTAGRVIGSSKGNSTSVESNPVSVVKQHLSELLQSFCLKHHQSLEDCAALCLGTSGMDTEASKRQLEHMLSTMSLSCPSIVVNDADIALHANTRGKPGIILISGTGSICYGVNQQGETCRVGGFGYILGDEGSSYWVARKGMSAALHAHDRTGPATRLLKDFCKALQIQEIEEVVDFVYQKNKSALGKLSYVVTEASTQGDEVARGIMAEARDELCLMVRTVAMQLEMVSEPTPLLLGGSFLLASQWLMDGLRAGLKDAMPNLQAAPMAAAAEWGAIFRAAALIGADSSIFNPLDA